MNFDNIKKSAKLMEEFGLTQLSYESGKEKICLKKELVSVGSSVVASTTKPSLTDAPVTEGKEFLSPLVGIFYRAPNPNAKKFVEKGQKIANGDILCIIESMKVMNEIHADFDGEIIEILIENGESVEYNQALFKYE